VLDVSAGAESAARPRQHQHAGRRIAGHIAEQPRQIPVQVIIDRIQGIGTIERCMQHLAVAPKDH